MREQLAQAKRIVVKVGTGVLTDPSKQPDLAQFGLVTRQLAALARTGREVILVTSGAVGAGMGLLGHEKRPKELAELQACAAVGQSRLMATYTKLFARHKMQVAQVLLTHDDLRHHERHLNARNTLLRLLSRGIVPIINENDAVSHTEIKFGDNDKLSALVACLLPADALIILTTVEGLIRNYGTSKSETISTVELLDESIRTLASGTNSSTAVGGMISKLEAAKIAIRAGIPMVIASGRKKGVLERIISAKVEGTLFVPQATKLPGRKRWIAFFHRPKGVIVVDDGARKAVFENGKSLLAPGIIEVRGKFDRGEVVEIRDRHGLEFARGLVGISASDLEKVGQKSKGEVIHRNNLVVL